MAGVGAGADAGVGEWGAVTFRARDEHRAGGARSSREYNIAPMVILALDTVTRAGSMALLDGDVCHARAGDPSTTHTERLPGEWIDWLERHGRRLEDVDLLAVVTGPGSFTGLRVGIAAVQGLALAGRKRVIGVPTLDALVASWQPREPGAVLAVACVDGQRGDVFLAAWWRRHGEPFENAVLIHPPSVETPEAAVSAMAARAGDAPVVVLGDGGVRYRDQWSALPHVEVARDMPLLAESAARIAAAHPDRGGTPHALRPIYIRRPDAELARERSRTRARALAATPPAADVIVTRADPACDLSAVEVLQASAFTNPWPAESIRWELEHTDVARLYLMHDAAGVLIGFCACWIVFDELHVNSFAVVPERRRQGLATHLLREVFRDARAAGATAATLEVRASNVAARRLYERLGFAVEGVRLDYYQTPREDALILWNRNFGTGN